MRKAAIVFLVAAISLSIVAVAGCGKDQSAEDAKAFLLAGNDYYDTFKTEWEGLQETQTSMVTQVMGGDYSAITGEAGEQMAADIEKDFTSMEANLKSANAEFAKIDGLEGVPDYKEYAGLMQEAIALWLQVLESAMSFKDDVMAVLQEMAAGKQVDIMAALTENVALQEISSLSKEADGKYKEAKALLEEKELTK